MDEPVRADLGSQPVRAGLFEIFLNRGELYKSGRRVPLQEQPFRVLMMLVERPGELITRRELQAELWPHDTYVGFDEGLNTAIRKLRLAFGDSADNPRFVETVPRRGYRFIAPVSRDGNGSNGALHELVAASEPSKELEFLSAGPRVELSGRKSPLAASWKWLAGLAVVCLAMGGAGAYWYLRAPASLNEGDTIVIADLVNTTLDPAFDGSLKQALAGQLEQSPFISVVPDKRVVENLRMMGRPATERVTGEIGREICLRTGSEALLEGTISTLGNHYLIGLNALACGSGANLAREQVEAAKKEDVLAALSKATKSLRTKLGESLPSVEKYDVPVEATTTSLEALKNYSLGVKVIAEKGDVPSIPFLKRAIELDPNFPMAYGNLGARYGNLNQPSQALEFATRAYQLRDRATEREKLRISAWYFRATGELEKQAQIFELWMAEYPHDATPHGMLGANHFYLGQNEAALAQWQHALQREPNSSVNIYENLGRIYIALNRFDEAEAICNQALARNLDSGGLRWFMYYLAFVRNDSARMGQQLAWAAGKPGDEDRLLFAQSSTEAFYGRVDKARDFSRRAVDSAVRADAMEAAALWQVTAALREAEFGETALAKRNLTQALALSSGRNVRILAALALARLGETARAKQITQQLRRSYPSNTVLNLGRLPAIDAAIELSNGHSRQALQLLEIAKPYELGEPSPSPLETLWPPYLRGQAYLLAHNGKAAALEFQKILDHPGIALNEAIAALAHVQIARAYAMAGNKVKAKAAYQDFLALWKDADPDIPIYKQVKSEYAKLQ